ncbi:hypothetical protein VTI74DRAFT_6480 [Chaetomium olivicolor]
MAKLHSVPSELPERHLSRIPSAPRLSKRAVSGPVLADCYRARETLVACKMNTRDDSSTTLFHACTTPSRKEPTALAASQEFLASRVQHGRLRNAGLVRRGG